MEDLMSNAFDGFWNESKPAKKKTADDENWDAFWGRGMYTPQPREISMRTSTASRGSQFVQDVKPVQYKQEVRRGLTQAQQYKLIKEQQAARMRTNKMIARAIKSVVSSGKSAIKRTTPVVSKAIKSTDTYQKYEIKKEKDKMWNQYKVEKATEAKKAELEAYKKKLYGDKK